MNAKLKSIAQRYAATQQPRDRLGRWVAQNKGTIATKAIAAGAGIAGGAIAGPAGVAAGQLLGNLVARPAIALGEAAMSKSDQAFHSRILNKGRDLQKTATRVREALSQVDANSLEDVMSKDLLGWTVAHAANYGLNHLIPGADLIPGKGGAVAALTVGQLHKLKAVAKRRYGKPQSHARTSATPAPT
ncbi:MAG: hypothetical protein F6K42_00600 [Leptolyngbya sp. SIO1D8]|nr:hypothetical protein [Leptolyngbya sp. SIO1D8]